MLFPTFGNMNEKSFPIFGNGRPVFLGMVGNGNFRSPIDAKSDL